MLALKSHAKPPLWAQQVQILHEGNRPFWKSTELDTHVSAASMP